MIKLSTSPLRGSSLDITFSFLDGNVPIVPISVCHTLLAYPINADEETSVVNGIYMRPTEPASVIHMLFSGADLELIPGHTTLRAVLVEWTYLLRGAVTSSKELIDFEIEPSPAINPATIPPVLPTGGYTPRVLGSRINGSSVSVFFNYPMNQDTLAVSLLDVTDENDKVEAGCSCFLTAEGTTVIVNLTDPPQPTVRDYELTFVDTFSSLAGLVIGVIPPVAFAV